MQRLALSPASPPSTHSPSTSPVLREIALALPSEEPRPPRPSANSSSGAGTSPRTTPALLSIAARADGATRSGRIHVLSVEDGGGLGEIALDRLRSVGRGRSLRAPASLDKPALSGTTDVVLDAVCGLRSACGSCPAVRCGCRSPPGPRSRRRIGAGAEVPPSRRCRAALALAFTHAQSLSPRLLAEDADFSERLASCLFYMTKLGTLPAGDAPPAS